jgi:hypothetical protein
MNSATISGTPDTVAQGVTFSVNVTDSANQAATQSYTVSILAQPDTLTLSPASLNFGPQLAGTASGTQTGTLTNTGSSPVAINNVASTGTNAGDFSESNTCGSSLAPGSDCAIHVTFTPARSGPRAASIAITDDTVGSPHQLPLSGTGLTSGPNATLSATSLIFPNQNVGTTSTALTITLTNYGEAPLNVSGIAATANFAESDSCVGSLVRATSCPINVTFIPSSAGSITSTLSVTDNAADSPQTVPLSGTGVAACLPQGAMCYGPAHPQCCAVPRPHHAVCSNPNGWGTCVED